MNAGEWELCLILIAVMVLGTVELKILHKCLNKDDIRKGIATLKWLNKRDSEIYEKGYADGYKRARMLGIEENRKTELELQEYKNLEKMNWKENIHIEMGENYGTLILCGHVFHVYLADIESILINHEAEKCKELDKYANKFTFCVK
jgi:hypothetical protein